LRRRSRLRAVAASTSGRRSSSRREALEVELRFFVLAWQARHPEVELEIVA